MILDLTPKSPHLRCTPIDRLSIFDADGKGDDYLTDWGSTGPTWDGFAKPDVLAPGTYAISFMYNDHDNSANSSQLVQEHPDYSETSDLFRMNGTSMATGITSGVAGASSAGSGLPSVAIASRIALNTEIASMNGGSPTAFER